MKRINIYITRQQKDKLDKLRNKYKVSLSTIADKCTYWLFYYIHHYSNKETMEKLKNEYLQKQNNYKTCIKPKSPNDTLENEISNKSIFISNALIIFIEKKANEYLEQKIADRYYTKIDKELKETLETFWDMNNQIRTTRRMIRQNKGYWKKVIEEC